jgi:hypothetical protein
MCQPRPHPGLLGRSGLSFSPPIVSIPPGSSFRGLVVVLLLLLGAVLWRTLGYITDPRAVLVAAVVFLVLLVPPIWRQVARALDQIRRPSSRLANWTAGGVAIVSVVLLYAVAANQGRPFVPTYHDEHTHLVQMQMLARGRLFMPQHPLADFFETFHLFVKPVYAASYFPGTSLLYVPTVWLHLPYWFMPLLVSGAAVGMGYRVLTELVDGVAGMLGALILLSLQPFRFASIMMLSHPLMMLWGLLGIWTWLLWRRQQQRGWAFLLGIVFGWAVITRPLDALCLAVPLGVGILWDLRARPLSHRLKTLGLIFAGAIPFLTVQLIANYSITGHLLETPYQHYWAQTYGGMAVGFAPFNREWKGNLLQQRIYHEYVNVPAFKTHTVGAILPNLYKSRLPTTLQADLPDTILLILVPVGILALTDFRRWLVWSILPILVGAYSLFSFFLPHYALPAALPLALMLILGIRVVADTWPGRKRAIEATLTVIVASFAITAMPGLWPKMYDQGSWPLMTAVHKLLPKTVRTPAVVLFPYHLGDNYHEEPVYNIDVAWPDDAPIIHVQDLGPERDQELATYYAKTQPDRNFYLFDRHRYALRPLGKPADFLVYLKGKLEAEGTGPRQSGRGQAGR